MIAISVYSADGKELVNFANECRATNWEEALAVAALNCIAFQPKPPEAAHAKRLPEKN